MKAYGFLSCICKKVQPLPMNKMNKIGAQIRKDIFEDYNKDRVPESQLGGSNQQTDVIPTETDANFSCTCA